MSQWTPTIIGTFIASSLTVVGLFFGGGFWLISQEDTLSEERQKKIASGITQAQEEALGQKFSGVSCVTDDDFVKVSKHTYRTATRCHIRDEKITVPVEVTDDGEGGSWRVIE